MKYLLLACALWITACCDKDEDTSTTVPQCIKEKYLLSSNSNLVVKQYKKDGETFYFFNTGAVTYDGAEFIYNADCSENCFYCGFCVEKECINDFPEYNSNAWVKVLPE